MAENRGTGVSAFRTLTRFKWAGAACAWLVSLCGWAYVAQLPEVYEIDARLFVDARSLGDSPKNLAPAGPDAAERADQLQRFILTRGIFETLALRVAPELDGASARQSLINRLAESSRIHSVDGKNLFSVRFQAPGAEFAGRLGEDFVAVLSESMVMATLDEQIHASIQRLKAAKEELQQWIVQRDARPEASAPEPRPGANRSGGQSPLDARIAMLEQRRDKLPRSHGNAHPEAASIEKSIADLKRMKTSLTGEPRSADGAVKSGPGAPSPAPSGALEPAEPAADPNAEIAALTAEIRTLQEETSAFMSRLNEHRKAAESSPRRNLDLDAIHAEYQTLLGRMSTPSYAAAEPSSAGGTPAAPHPRPEISVTQAWPDRTALSVAVLPAAAGAGLLLTVLLAIFRPAFTSPHPLHMETGRAVLGSVSMHWTRTAIDRSRYGAAVFMLAVVSLVFALGGIVLLHGRGFHLPNLI